MTGQSTIGETTVQSGQLPTSLDPVKLVLQGFTQFITVAIQWFNRWQDARAFTISEQTLGERFIDQVPGVDQALFDAGLLSHRGEPGKGNYVDSHYGNYGTIVPMARQVMTLLFGVRITNDDDLDSLDEGVNAYYSRPDKEDIPQAAVERAVYLKQNYFPISTYNTVPWDLSKFATIPYAAPIPGVDPHTLMNGDLPGGGKIIEGIVQVPGAFTPASQPGGGTATESIPTGGGSAAGSGTSKTGLLILAAIAAILIFSGDGK